ncbi:group I intron-associated PD-(D/E)XK endonuclease [Cytobacillus gottheilii]|uniref:PD(D/E)XK endonuclease domain-containing protein n=1 Tax=Cytobacillus gottheilii TaxID=859144 RepID=A0ABX8FAT6_9BACI|nr:group I intron-associated PD-(D/E)XK endonuclease [Cytobacillus gottheilii]QVY60581.1 hypothetical protein J1899_16435 [Cytobacillus gottheilii]
MQHHTKNKGDLGVLKAQVDLYQKGFMVMLPLTEHAPFDLVIYKDGSFKRVQVKFRNMNHRGNLEVRFRSSYYKSTGAISKPVDKEEVDIYCIYCPQTDECYYLDPKNLKESVTLRLTPAKNNQSKLVKMASDFRDLPLGY